jgi:hypothetical protein
MGILQNSRERLLAVLVGAAGMGGKAFSPLEAANAALVRSGPDGQIMSI